MSAKPSLSVTAGAPALQCAAAGAWTAAHADELETVIDGAARDLGQQTAAIDMQRVEAFDTYGAWLLERLVRERKANGGETEIVALPEHYRDLYAAMHDAVLDKPAEPPKENPVTEAVEKLVQAAREDASARGGELPPQPAAAAYIQARN